MKELELTLSPGPAVRVRADTALVLLPLDERPLGGEAGRIDWRLCGEISSLLANGYASGASGESMLIPAGPPVAAERLLLFGLGHSKNLGARRIEQAIRRAAAKAIELTASSLVLALPEALRLSVDAEAILSGLILALDQSESVAHLDVRIPEPEGPERSVPRAVEALGPEAAARGIRVHLSRQQAPDVPVGGDLPWLASPAEPLPDAIA